MDMDDLFEILYEYGWRPPRTAQDINKLRLATQNHIKDVANGMNYIAREITRRGREHDHTKTEAMERYQKAELTPPGGAEKTSWKQHHTTTERHHLKVHVPSDVNLIDVIEHVVDCTVSGMVRSRSGFIRDTDLSSDVLQQAVANTVRLIQSNVSVVRSAPIGEGTDLSDELIDEEPYQESEDLLQENVGDLSEELIEEAGSDEVPIDEEYFE